MTSQDFNDDVLIDRLVDGELSPTERRTLLTELDAHPDGWRRCALAFVEAQTLRSELRQIVAASTDRSSDRESAIPAARRDLPAFIERSAARWRSSISWLALAAGLLLAFGLGREIGVGERLQLQNVQVADSTTPTSSTADSGSSNVLEKAAARSNSDAVTLVVNDHRGVPHRVSVPLVEARQLGAEFAEVPTWTSPELLRRLDQQGLGLAARRRYAPLYFEQQNQRIPFVVPVDDAVVTPISRSVY